MNLHLPKVMGIDDSPTVHAKMQHLLQSLAEYRGYGSWEGAKKMLIADRPAVILIDL